MASDAIIGLAAGALSNGGSAGVLRGAGRLAGLGQHEQAELVANGFPSWAVAALGLLGGAMAGVYLQRRWPRQIDRVWR